MQDLMSFFVWVVGILPDFLLAPPISGFIGIALGIGTIALFKRLCNI